jgi:hypothetical protein
VDLLIHSPYACIALSTETILRLRLTRQTNNYDGDYMTTLSKCRPETPGSAVGGTLRNKTEGRKFEFQ